MSTVQFKLKNKYKYFFKEFNIDEETGYLKNHSGFKFPTFPYIGSKYGKSKKILIIGLDIGSDEKSGEIQSFEERRRAIEDKGESKYNPHIAGTYFTALFFLKNKFNLQSHWEKLRNKPTFQKALKIKKDCLVSIHCLTLL